MVKNKALLAGVGMLCAAAISSVLFAGTRPQAAASSPPAPRQAGVPAQRAAAPAPPAIAPRQAAALYVFDVSMKTLIPEKNIVIDNGKKVGEMRREHYLIVLLAPGHHLLWLKYGPKGDRVQIDAVAGQTYYAAGGYHPVMPASLANTTFAPVTKAQAEAYLGQMKPMPPE